MREVDEALARAYAQREKGDPPRGVPPAPHWPAQRRARPTSRADPCPATSPQPRRSGRAGPPDRGRAAMAGRRAGLERDWGDRFDRLAERLIEGRQRQNLRVILFTSCHRAEGRTTLVLTLARALARHPCRTVLVDADLTGPMLARLLGLRPEVGLDDVVEGGQALSDALIDAPDDHLAVLPIRCAVARPRDFLAAPGLDLHPRPAPPRVRPDPPGRRPAVHRPERGGPPSLGRRRRARLPPRPHRRARDPPRPRGPRGRRRPAAGAGRDVRLDRPTWAHRHRRGRPRVREPTTAWSAGRSARR